nr:hypothetical protein [Tanacetum cinerariifolium]
MSVKSDNSYDIVSVAPQSNTHGPLGILKWVWAMEIEKLKLLEITKISIPTPTIVFCGENSAGKSRLINSLFGTLLPVGEDGNISKHPLIMKITGKPKNTNAETEFFLEDERGVKVSVKEDGLSAAFKTITNRPLKLHVKKVYHPDVTLVDLPGTSRVDK